MACCIVGSLLMVAFTGVARGIKEHLLRRQADSPESWRLHGG